MKKTPFAKRQGERKKHGLGSAASFFLVCFGGQKLFPARFQLTQIAFVAGDADVAFQQAQIVGAGHPLVLHVAFDDDGNALMACVGMQLKMMWIVNNVLVFGSGLFDD